MRTAIAGVLVVAAAALPGCAILPQSHSCVSWVQFDSAQEMFDEATLVVDAIVGEATGDVAAVSGPAIWHEVEVVAVHKGEPESDVIRVASPRDWCVADPPQPDDPLREGDDVLLFLQRSEADSIWQTLTSRQGVLPSGDDLPFEVEAGG